MAILRGLQFDATSDDRNVFILNWERGQNSIFVAFPITYVSACEMSVGTKGYFSRKHPKYGFYSVCNAIGVLCPIRTLVQIIFLHRVLYITPSLIRLLTIWQVPTRGNQPRRLAVRTFNSFLSTILSPFFTVLLEV